MIKGFTPRLYQETILATCTRNNTLVVLPTGMGKSILFVLLAAHRLKNYPSSKILILAPTLPLCEQHVNTLKDCLDVDASKIVPRRGEKPLIVQLFCKQLCAFQFPPCGG